MTLVIKKPLKKLVRISGKSVCGLSVTKDSVPYSL